MDIARADRGVQKPTSERPDEIEHGAMLVRLDLSGRLVDASLEFLKHSGQTIQQIRGLALENYLDPDSRTILKERIAQILAGEPAESRINVHFHNGRAIDIDIQIDGDAQKPHGVTLLVHPSQNRMVSTDLQSNSFKARMLDDIEKIDDVMYVWNKHGICLDVNHAIHKYHINPEDIKGQHFSDFVVPEDQEKVARIFERIQQGHIETAEFRIINPAGERFLVKSYNQPIFDQDQIIGMSGLLIDAAGTNDFRQMLERRAAQLSVLNRIGQELFLTVDLDTILLHAVQTLQSSFGYFHVAIFLPDPHDNHPYMAARAGTISSLFPPNHALRPGQGLVGWVFEHHETVVVNNVTLDPRYINFYPDRIPTRSELVVPIQTGGQFFGVLDAQSPIENAFDQNDALVFETVSRQLALGIENANLYHQVGVRLQQQERAEALMRLQRDLLAGLSTINDFSEVLNVVLETLTRIEGIDGGSIYLVDETGGLDMVAYKGLTPAFAAAVSYLPPEAHKTQFVMSGRTDYMRYASLPFDPRIPADVRSTENILSLAVLPIQYQSEVIANLTLCSHSMEDIPQDSRVVIEAIAAQLGVVIARIKSEKALAVNRAQSMALLEAVPDLILEVDASGRLHYIKQGIDTASYGLPDNTLGKQIQQYLSKDYAEFVLGKIREALASGQTQLFNYKLYSKEKQQDEFFEARVSAVDEELAILIIRKNTDQRIAELKIENSDRKYHALFDLNRDAVLLYSIEDVYLEGNQKVVDLLGYSDEELRGKSYLQLVVPEQQEQARQRLRALLAGEIFPMYQRTFLHKNGEHIPCEVNMAVVSDVEGKPLYIQSILRDISQPNQAGNRLQYNDRFQHSFSGLIRQLLLADDSEKFFPEILQEITTCFNANRSLLIYRDLKNQARIRSIQWPATSGGHKKPEIPSGDDLLSVWHALTGQNAELLQHLAEESTQVMHQRPVVLPNQIAAPIYTAGKLTGILTIEGKTGKSGWLDEEIDFIHNFALLAGRRLESG